MYIIFYLCFPTGNVPKTLSNSVYKYFHGPFVVTEVLINTTDSGGVTKVQGKRTRKGKGQFEGFGG